MVEKKTNPSISRSSFGLLVQMVYSCYAKVRLSLEMNTGFLFPHFLLAFTVALLPYALIWGLVTHYIGTILGVMIVGIIIAEIRERDDWKRLKLQWGM